MHAVRRHDEAGSGVRVSADMAVKCSPAMATHIRLVPLSTARQPEAAREDAHRHGADHRADDQRGVRHRPGPSAKVAGAFNAAMPVKCIDHDGDAEHRAAQHR